MGNETVTYFLCGYLKKLKTTQPKVSQISFSFLSSGRIFALYYTIARTNSMSTQFTLKTRGKTRRDDEKGVYLKFAFAAVNMFPLRTRSGCCKFLNVKYIITSSTVQNFGVVYKCYLDKNWKTNVSHLYIHINAVASATQNKHGQKGTENRVSF